MSFIDIDYIVDATSFYAVIFREDAPCLISSKKWHTFDQPKWNSFLLKHVKKEEVRISKKVKGFLRDYLCKQFDDEKNKVIRAHWPAILRQAFFNIGERSWNAQALFKTETLRKVFKELNEVIIGIEVKGLRFYGEPEMVDGEDSKNIIKYLLHDIALEKRHITWENFRKLFRRQDPKLLEDLRSEFQNVFSLLYDRVKNDSEHEDLVVEMLLGNLLSFYAFTDPKEGEKVFVPQKSEKGWVLVEYQVELIELTPEWMGEPITAIGLKPKTSANSLLLFQGTPLPGAKAAHLAELTDFTPGCSLGKLVYHFGKDKIADWLNISVQESSKNVKIYGQSLGGALAYHTAKSHPDLVEISGYAPPGLLSWKSNAGGKKQEAAVNGKVFCHANDIVYLLGAHPESATLIKVITEKRRNPYLAHLRSYGCEKVLLLKVNNVRENRRPIRKVMTFLHQFYSVPFFTLKLGVLGMILAKKKMDVFLEKRPEMISRHKAAS
jgi:hypothetical protein